MSFRKFMLLAASVAFVLITMTSLASASSFPAIIVYGDSLSDNGNLYALAAYPPSPPYDQRFSNGPVAVEQMAAAFGAPLFDFAYGGATSGIGNFVDGGTQTAPGMFGLPGMQVELAASAPFLMMNPGLTPDFYGDPVATAYAQQFNALLLASLPSGATYFDTFNLLHQITSDPSAFGLTDVTDPCFNGTTVCSNPDQYLFWAGFHPTTAADAIVAKDFADAATPEPSSIMLLGSGLSGLMVLVQHRRRKAA